MSWSVLTSDCLAVEWPTVDVLITDPPYESEAHTKARRTRSVCEGRVGTIEIPFDPMTEASRELVGQRIGSCVKRWSLVFCQVEAAMLWRASIDAEYVRTMVWVKPDATPQLTGDRPGQGYESIVVSHRRKGRKRWNGGGRRGVFTEPVNPTNRTHEHPTEKNLSLMMQLVELFSEPGETILDPFCGSGTTLVAAIRLGRNAIGIEREDKWANLARERCSAEEKGITLDTARAGQVPLFGGAA